MSEPDRITISYSWHRHDRFEIHIFRLIQGTARVSKLWRAKVSLHYIFLIKCNFTIFFRHEILNKFLICFTLRL